MSSLHDIEHRSGHTLDLLTDEIAGLRIAVTRKGAELVSIARRQPDGTWLGFLYRDGEVEPPSQGWANHATVMGYYLHRLKGERTTYRGREIRGGNHSFLRSKQFPEPKVTSDSLTYSLAPSEIAP